MNRREITGKVSTLRRQYKCLSEQDGEPSIEVLRMCGIF